MVRGLYILTSLLVLLAAACGGGAKEAAPSGEPQSTYAGSGKRLAYCCRREAKKQCAQEVASCSSDDGEYKSEKAVPYDEKWTKEIRHARRAETWCCYSWTISSADAKKTSP